MLSPQVRRLTGETGPVNVENVNMNVEKVNVSVDDAGRDAALAVSGVSMGLQTVVRGHVVFLAGALPFPPILSEDITLS